MSALLFLIPISLGLASLATVVLLWAIRNGQFSSLENRMPDDD